ncbi:sulfatase family protein [Pelagicoccus mobilis]|uniref:Sulfatase n=1 Tax=Pelagicoccus mobilis TaxID=415221 RepID=A0A934VP98_9BACT|nr:sulfatase [Pelagicoccus mobilis]MBK1875314.1 sulfatase [Pelagicoccus mobilis]
MSQVKKYNILYIMSDDHASHAIGAYGGRLAGLDLTPNIDALAADGILFRNCFVTNAICTPSRACILTGQHSQTNGVLDLNGSLPTEKQYLPQELSKLGYETALVGKWHLHEEPNFDYYKVMADAHEQGSYYDPAYFEKGVTEYGDLHANPELATVKEVGHSSDINTDSSLDWLENKRDRDKPFFLMHHFKAPHDYFEYARRYEDFLADIDVPEPDNLYDQSTWGSIGTRGENDSLRRVIGTSVSRRHEIRNYVFNYFPEGGPEDDREATHQAYQHYLKRYLRCVKGIDDNLNRLFGYLKENDLWDNTIIVYTSDQGMMLGEHDLQDKRWMYEESANMPLIIRHPDMDKRGVETDMLVNNVDYAPTVLDFAKGETPSYMQGRSFAETVATGDEVEGWDSSVYYRYWMHMVHHDVPANFGIRTKRYKLMFYYGYHFDESQMGTPSTEWVGKCNKVVQTPAAWELYDLERDPDEDVNRYSDPEYKDIIAELKAEILKKRAELNEGDEKYPHLQAIIDAHWED